MGVSPCFNAVLLLNLPSWKGFYDCKKKRGGRLKAYDPAVWVSWEPALIKHRIRFFLYNVPVPFLWRAIWIRMDRSTRGTDVPQPGNTPGLHKTLQEVTRFPRNYNKEEPGEGQRFSIAAPCGSRPHMGHLNTYSFYKDVLCATILFC